MMFPYCKYSVAIYCTMITSKQYNSYVLEYPRKCKEQRAEYFE